jgi:hypothetical protein
MGSANHWEGRPKNSKLPIHKMAIISDTNNPPAAKPTFARYLGIDIRPRRFGFVLIENSIVLDSGTRMCERPHFDNCLGQGFDRILKTYHPSALIVRGANGVVANARKRRVAAAIKRRAKQRSVEVISIRPATMRRYFHRYNATTKYQIAQSVASLLPELAWKLPNNRKPWETEHFRMSIFDAAAVVIAHLEL